jgi:hypothetical protein
MQKHDIEVVKGAGRLMYDPASPHHVKQGDQVSWFSKTGDIVIDCKPPECAFDPPKHNRGAGHGQHTVPEKIRKLKEGEPKEGEVVKHPYKVTYKAASGGPPIVDDPDIIIDP